jgi:hypothetical protein
MWSLARMSQVGTRPGSISADELRELADKIEKPAFDLPTLLEREWRLTSHSRSREFAKYFFESNRRDDVCLSVHINLSAHQTAPLNE